ncbi:hypothetical protein HDU96_001367 [Phlyctochytrium bullatum]|nr:hypothetical protein HDU96_001367 [Phlyctochytrium bullatum]
MLRPRITPTPRLPRPPALAITPSRLCSILAHPQIAQPSTTSRAFLPRPTRAAPTPSIHHLSTTTTTTNRRSPLNPNIVEDNYDGTLTHGFWDPPTGTWTFLVVDKATGLAAIVDSIIGYDLSTGAIDTTPADRLLAYVDTLPGVAIAYLLETHVHADHLTGANYIKTMLGGKTPVVIGDHTPAVQTLMKQRYGLPDTFPTDGSQFDILLHNGATLPLGHTQIHALHTPGHTPACLSYLIATSCYVGDALFPPDVGTGRTDFPGGSPATLHASLTARILALPPTTRLYAGHDYPPEGRSGPVAWNTVEEQRRGNKHVGGEVGVETFVRVRRERDGVLGQPRLLHASLQVNLGAGRLPESDGSGRGTGTPQKMLLLWKMAGGAEESGDSVSDDEGGRMDAVRQKPSYALNLAGEVGSVAVGRNRARGLKPEEAGRIGEALLGSIFIV